MCSKEGGKRERRERKERERERGTVSRREGKWEEGGRERKERGEGEGIDCHISSVF